MPREASGFSLRVETEHTRSVMLAFRELPQEARQGLVETSAELAEMLADDMRRKGRSLGHQAALLAGTVRVKSGQRPQVEVGGTMAVGRHGAHADDLLIGSEFGHSGQRGRGRGSRDFAPHGFRPRKSSGMWIYPTLEHDRETIGELYYDAAQDVVAEFTKTAKGKSL